MLVAVAKREVVGFYQRAAEAAGLKLVALGLLPSASARCVEACRVAERGQAYALVSLRPDEVSIDIVADQAVPFSRSVERCRDVWQPTHPSRPLRESSGHTSFSKRAPQIFTPSLVPVSAAPEICSPHASDSTTHALLETARARTQIGRRAVIVGGVSRIKHGREMNVARYFRGRRSSGSRSDR